MDRREILSGKFPKGFRILDAHAHLGNGEQGKMYIPALPVEKTLELNRKIGIGAVMASSFRSLYGDVVPGNEDMMALSRKYPGEVYTSIYYDPKYHEACMAQLEKYWQDPGFVGVKIHPHYSSCSLGSREYDPIYAWCCDHNVLLASHTWKSKDAGPEHLFGIMERFPSLSFQMCHMGGMKEAYLVALEVANRYPRILLDINGSAFSGTWLEEVVKMAPLEQFVFSTDVAFNEPAIQVGRVLLSSLSDEVKQKILCDNMEAYLGRRLVK